MKELEQTMGQGDAQMNMSRFYVKNNKVIDNVADIEKKEDINKFAIEVAKKERQANSCFTGQIINRKRDRDDLPQSDKTHDRTNGDETINDDSDLTNEETKRERMIKVFKANSSRLLHERNKYVFLATVAEDAISLSLISKYNLSEMVGFLLIKKLFYMIGELKEVLEKEKNVLKLEEWEEYVGTKDYNKIYVYISKEYDVFKVYYDSMHDNVYKNSQKEGFTSELVEKALNIDNKKDLEDIFNETLIKYAVLTAKAMDMKKIEEDVHKWNHVNQVIDCLTLDDTFAFKKGDKQFNFKLFYENFAGLDLDELKDLVKKKLSKTSVSLGY